MTTINATWLQTAFDDDDISATKAETVIEDGIDLLNTFGANLDNLTGDAGSKTGTYTSIQAGAIKAMARKVYATHYKNASGTASNSLGPAGISYNADTALLEYAETLASKIKGESYIAFVVAEDTSGLT